MKARHVASIALAVQVACAPKNAMLGGSALAASSSCVSSARIMRVHYDRNGDLYPGRVIDPPLADFQINLVGTGYTALQEAFDAAAFGDSVREPWRALLARLNVTEPDRKAAWERVQDSLVGRTGRQLQDLLAPVGGRRPTLVVLVHGFNNLPHEAAVSYDSVRRAIAGRYVDCTSTVYLEVYWDGRKHWAGIPSWGYAQDTFTLSGFAFRRVLAAVPEDVPIRILAHSSGAPLIASALWDAQGALDPKARRSGRFAVYTDTARNATGVRALPTAKSIRVGMIAPAMPADVFYTARDSGPLIAERVVLGVNKKDFAIRKGGYAPIVEFRHVLHPPKCRWWGSSCLASHPDQYCKRLKVGMPRLAGQLRVIDFTDPRQFRDPKGLWLLTRHDFTKYLARDDMGRFLDLVFADSSTVVDDQAVWCKG